MGQADGHQTRDPPGSDLSSKRAVAEGEYPRLVAVWVTANGKRIRTSLLLIPILMVGLLNQYRGAREGGTPEFAPIPR